MPVAHRQQRKTGWGTSTAHAQLAPLLRWPDPDLGSGGSVRPSSRAHRSPARRVRTSSVARLLSAITRIARRWRGSPRFLSPQSARSVHNHIISRVDRPVTGWNDVRCFMLCLCWTGHACMAYERASRKISLLFCGFPFGVCSVCRWSVNGMPEPVGGGLCAVEITNLGLGSSPRSSVTFILGGRTSV